MNAPFPHARTPDPFRLWIAYEAARDLFDSYDGQREAYSFGSPQWKAIAQAVTAASADMHDAKRAFRAHCVAHQITAEMLQEMAGAL